jgi:hypothetical protein
LEAADGAAGLRYRRDTLIEKFGLEITMPDLRHLIARCPGITFQGKLGGLLRGPERFTTMSIFQRLYNSEINFEVSGFYDAGFDVRLGDHLNGFLAEGKVETWAEAEAWLREQALAHFPDSKFAQDELREAEAH